MKIPFDNRFVTLGDKFHVKTSPVAVSKPALIRFNEALANSLGFSAAELDESDVAALFAGNQLPEDAAPIAMAYAGHQFGHFVPQLGDGRAILLGEVAGVDGVHYGLHLKGSGRTAFSRNGDGRAALGPVLREYLVSEAMAALNVPTTRALAAVSTGEDVARERYLPGGVITRLASSFVRVGTFEYFRASGDAEAIRKLADYVIQHNYPSLTGAENSYLSLLQAVVERQARLIARWMQLGFIHGVMNTDNMSVAGETIDYGPCAFMDAYQHDKVFSSIDELGRYAYNKQPGIGLWNLTRFAECLIPLLADDTNEAIEMAQQVLHTYRELYEDRWLAGMRAKCGLAEQAGMEQSDKALIESLLDVMNKNRADFTLTFFHLSRLDGKSPEGDSECRALFAQPEQFDHWAVQWRERLEKETRNDEERQVAMQAVNPVYIPRNHQVEAAIRAAEDRNDFSLFHELHEVLHNPFVQQPGKEHYQRPPEPEEVVEHTFCGT
jgi:uncharacterized protein YdiU (UPF0061 family)